MQPVVNELLTRRIAVDLHNALIAICPEWASAKDDDIESEKGKAPVVKVVMTASDDGPDWQPHIRNKENRRRMASRFKDNKDACRSFGICSAALIEYNSCQI